MRKHFAAFRASRKGNLGGFTTIELLIATVVMGTTAGIVTATIGSTESMVSAVACNTSVETYISSIDEYYFYNLSYPTNLSDLTSPANGGPYIQPNTPSPTYYSVTLDPTSPGTVDVTLSSIAPGYGDDNATPGMPEPYNTFTFPATIPGTTTVNPYAGHNICVGA